MKLNKGFFGRSSYISLWSCILFFGIGQFSFLNLNSFASVHDSSLIIAFEKADNKDKVLTLQQLSKRLIISQPDSALKAAYLAQHLSDSLEFDSLLFQSNLLLADIYYANREFSNAFKYIFQAENFAINQSKITWVQICDIRFGDIFYAVHELETARKFYKSALEINLENDSANKIFILLKYGSTFDAPPIEPNFAFSPTDLIISIKKLNRPDLLARANHLQGTYSLNADEFKEAEKYFSKAISLIESNSLQTIENRCYYDDLAITYSLLNKPGLAISTIKKRKGINPNTSTFALQFSNLTLFLDSMTLNSPSNKTRLISIGQSNSLIELKQLYEETINTSINDCSTHMSLTSNLEQISAYINLTNAKQNTEKYKLNHQLKIRNMYSKNRFTLLKFKQIKTTWLYVFITALILLTSMIIGNYHYSFIPTFLNNLVLILLAISIGCISYIFISIDYSSYLSSHSFRHYGLIFSLIFITYWIFLLLKAISTRKHQSIN